MPKKKSKKSTRSPSLESKKRKSRSRSRSNSYLRKTRKSRSKSPKKSRNKSFKGDNERVERKIFDRSRSPDALKTKRKKKSRSRSWTRDRNENGKEEAGKKYRISRSRSRSRSYRKDLLYKKNLQRQKHYSRSRSISSRSRTKSRSRSISKSKNFRAYSSIEPKYSKWEGQNEENYPIPTINSNLTQISMDNQIHHYQNNHYRMPYGRYNKNAYAQSNYQYQYPQKQYLLNRQKSFQNLNQFGQYYAYINQPQVYPINYSSQNEIIENQTVDNREEAIKEEETEEENIPLTDESDISSQCDINEDDLKLIKSESNLYDELFPASFCEVKNLINAKNLNENMKRLHNNQKEDKLFKYLFGRTLQNNSSKFDLVYSCNFFN